MPSHPRPPILAVALLLAAVLLSSGVHGQGPAASPGPAAESSPTMDCMTPLLNMTDCLTYVEQGSKTAAPDKGCCPALAGLIESNPVCLCELVSGGETYGIKIDNARALKLPAACHVDTPPVSLCSLLGIPVASPFGLAPSPSSGGPSASIEEQTGVNQMQKLALKRCNQSVDLHIQEVYFHRK